MKIVPIHNRAPKSQAQFLMDQAKLAANEHVAQIQRLSAELQAHLLDVSGDAYPTGVREEFRRWQDDLSARADRVAAIMGRQ